MVAAYCLRGQQCLFAFGPPAVLPNGAGRPDDSMTGNQHGQTVGGDCRPDGSAGTWLPDGSRQLTVAAQMTFRDIQQSLPHFHLKLRTADVARKLLGLSILRNRLRLKDLSEPAGCHFIV
jgi:hypothetical protein